MYSNEDAFTYMTAAACIRAAMVRSTLPWFSKYADYKGTRVRVVIVMVNSVVTRPRCTCASNEIKLRKVSKYKQLYS